MSGWLMPAGRRIMSLFLHLSHFLHLIRPFNLCCVGQTHHHLKSVKKQEMRMLYSNLKQMTRELYISMEGLPFHRASS